MTTMKFSKKFIAPFFSGLVLIGCKETNNAPAETGVKEEKVAINPQNLEKATFNISGMTCAIGCAKTIEKKLSETSGITKATVDFDKKEAQVTFDNSLQSLSSLKKIVEGTADGQTYKVSNMVASK